MEKVLLITSDVLQVAPLSRNAMVQKNFRFACLSFRKIGMLHLQKDKIFPVHANSTHEELRSFLSSALRIDVCGRSPAEIVGSNPTGGMDICLL
jgi:hypothetical protein